MTESPRAGGGKHPSSAGRRGTAHRWIVLVAMWLTFVSAGCASDPATEPAEATPTAAAGISSLLLTTGLPSGWTWQSTEPVDAEVTVPGPGNRLLDQYRARMLQAHRARYLSSLGHQTDLVIAEMAGTWTNWISLSCEEVTSDEFGPAWACFRQTPDGRRAMIATSKGRLVVELFAPVGAQLQAEDLALFSAQVRALPELDPVPDIPASARRQLGDAFALRAGYTVFVSIMVVGLVAWVTNSLRDRGSREALRTIGHRPVRAEGIRDISPRAGRARGMHFASSVARLVFLAGLGAVLLAWSGLGTTVALVLLGLILLAQNAISMRVNQRRTRVDIGAGVRFVHTVGAAASSAMFIFFFAAFATLAVFVVDMGLGSNLQWTFIVALAVGFLYLATRSDAPLRVARRLTQPSAQKALAADHRSEVLLLRSFQDDDLEIRVRPTSERSLIESTIRESRTRFEEHVAWSFWRQGPVVAIGQPGTVLPPLGAAREYFDDHSWQEAVEGRMEHGSVIAMVVGRSSALQWEVGQIRRKGLLAKAVFVFPPLDQTETSKRLAVLSASLGLDLFELLPPGGRWPVVVGFAASGRPRLFVADGRDDVAYREAIAEAISLVEANGDVRISDPGPEWLSPDLPDPTPLLTKFDPTKKVGRRRSWLAVAWDLLWPAV